MPAQELLQSRVLLFYAGLVYGLLLAAGLLLVWLRWGLGKKVDHAWHSYRGWLCMVPLLTVAILLGRESTVVFFTGIGLLAFKEFARATGLDRDGYITGGAYLGILAVGVVTLAPFSARGTPGRYDLFMALPVFVIAGIFVIPILRDRVQGQLASMTIAIAGFLYFGWMGGHVGLLARSEWAYSHLLYLLFAVEVNDVAAFLGGKLFGRHALRGNISPKKTWEGALSALALSLALPWALWFTLPHFGPQDLVAIGLIVGIGGQLGDLAISVMKRDLGIKNMGALIPGHGGILDRIDSLIYVAPLFFHYLRYSHGLCPGG
jgi:phosphatidate cytidylyltransferase